MSQKDAIIGQITISEGKSVDISSSFKARRRTRLFSQIRSDHNMDDAPMRIQSFGKNEINDYAGNKDIHEKNMVFRSGSIFNTVFHWHAGRKTGIL